LYQKHNLTGGHVIALGPGNEQQVKLALQAYPQGLQFGGGVNDTNAEKFLEYGASHIIVTSYLFEDRQFSFKRLEAIKAITGKERLILDLSCRKVNNSWFIATDRWQTVTDLEVNLETLNELAKHCDEFLIHAADVEGLQQGIDADLVNLLGQFKQVPMTYAGGARSLEDLKQVNEISKGRVDLTIGSALDIFGGSGISFDQCLQWNKQR